MKTIIIILFLSFTIHVNGQLIVDDFTQGRLATTTLQSGESEILYQSGSTILGKKRRVQAKVRQNPMKHGIRYSVNDGLFGMSAGFDTRGTVFLSYGKDGNGNPPLNKDISKYRNMKISFDGQSTANGIYVALFTGTSRSVYKQSVKEREGRFELTIPLSDFKKVGDAFTFTNVDSIRMQFDARNKTGCNLAVSKIWFE